MPIAEKNEAISAHIATPMNANELRETCLRDVYRYIFRRVQSAEDAEDLTCETYAAALEQLGRGRIQYPRAWLLGIARRKVPDGLRRRTRRKETLLSELKIEQVFEGTQDQHVQNLERDKKVREIVDVLPEKQREALLLFYVEELSIAEIAQVMHKSPAAVNSLLGRARVAAFNEGKAYFLDTLEVNR